MSYSLNMQKYETMMCIISTWEIIATPYSLNLQKEEYSIQTTKNLDNIVVCLTTNLGIGKIDVL